MRLCACVVGTLVECAANLYDLAQSRPLGQALYIWSVSWVLAPLPDGPTLHWIEDNVL